MYTGQVCRVCSKPLPPAVLGQRLPSLANVHCSDCCNRTAYLDGCFYVGLYAGYLREVIRNLKFKGFAHTGLSLGRILADAIPNDHFRLSNTVVTPIPLHPSKYAERGYNQAETIAVGLSQVLSVPLCADALSLVRDIADQKRLTAAARVRNVMNAFAVKAPQTLMSRDVILVDDVMTTGSTLNEAARVMRLAGASSVTGVVVASGLGYPCLCQHHREDTAFRS